MQQNVLLLHHFDDGCCIFQIGMYMGRHWLIVQFGFSFWRWEAKKIAKVVVTRSWKQVVFIQLENFLQLFGFLNAHCAVVQHPGGSATGTFGQAVFDFLSEVTRVLIIDVQFRIARNFDGICSLYPSWKQVLHIAPYDLIQEGNIELSLQTRQGNEAGQHIGRNIDQPKLIRIHQPGHKIQAAVFEKWNIHFVSHALVLEMGENFFQKIGLGEFFLFFRKKLVVVEQENVVFAQGRNDLAAKDDAKLDLLLVYNFFELFEFLFRFYLQHGFAFLLVHALELP